MRLLAPFVVLVSVVVTVACGGSASPTAPTPPAVSTPAPAPAPPAAPRANLVTAGDLEFVSCINGLCSYRGLVRNDGNACAANISGEILIESAQGQEIGRALWAMSPAMVMRPGDEVPYEGVGMPQIVLNHLDGRAFARFTFDSRPC